MFDYNIQQPRYSPWAQLAILLILMGCMLLFSAILLPITGAWLNVPLKDVSEALQKPENVDANRFLQFSSTFLVMALPAFVFARIMNRNTFKYIGFNSAISGKQVFIVVGIVLVGLFVSGALSEANELIPISKSAEHYFKSLEDDYNKEMLAIANMKSLQDYITSLIVIALLPAIFEEMLFRGTLQPVMISITKNAFIGILITSILFSAMHGSYYGFLPRIGLGLIIGYVFYFSKNLWLSSITHFLYNAYGVTEMYTLSKQGLLNANAMNTDDTFSLFYGLIAAAALYVVFIFFKQESEVVISMYNFRNLPKEDHSKNIE